MFIETIAYKRTFSNIKNIRENYKNIHLNILKRGVVTCPMNCFSKEGWQLQIKID